MLRPDPFVADPAIYAALAAGAVRFDRSDRRRTLIDGAQAPAMLTGLVTNDVVGLAVGAGQYAAAPTPKGKILADCRILRLADARLLVDVPPLAAEGWQGMIAKFLPPRLAKHRNVSAEVGCLGVYGARAAAAVSGACGVDREAVASLPAYGVLPFGDAAADGWPRVIVRSPDLGVDGFDLFAPPAVLDDLVGALGSEVVAGDAATWHVARVAAGRPEWGIDMDDGTIPQEANFDQLHAISYTKGCYTGQETIARVHFRGHVNKFLRRITAIDGALGSGAALVSGEKDIGDVRSVADVPGVGRIGLAMVRREVADATEVTVRAPDGSEGRARISALPYVASDAT